MLKALKAFGRLLKTLKICSPFKMEAENVKIYGIYGTPSSTSVSIHNEI